MSSLHVTNPIADRMVEILFEDVTLTSREKILYPGCGVGELIAAVERYFEESVHDPPRGVAIDTEKSCVETVREDYGDYIEVRKQDYLSADNRLDSFEFVLGYPPVIKWTDLSEEKQREYANSFARVSPDTNRIDTGLLFLERSLHVLTADGNGVFLTPSTFKTDETKSPFRRHLAPKVADIEQVDLDSFEVKIPHLLIKLNSPEAEEFSPAASSNRPKPGEVEVELMASATSRTITNPARQIATCFPDLEVYHANDDAAFVYLDLYYEDYDAALVYDSPIQMENLRGYISRVEMEIRDEESVIEHVSRLQDSDCVDASEDIGSIIDRLGRDGERFCFVGKPTDPEGIITRFDLNKIPVYKQLYVLLARFEIQLRDIIRTHVPDWETETEVYVPTTFVNALAPDKLSGATLGDLLKILSTTNEMERIPVDFGAHEATLTDLKDLRNAIAHYNPLVHTMSNDSDSDWTAGTLRDRYNLLQDIVEL